MDAPATRSPDGQAIGSWHPENAPGWTCCQAADLRNHQSELSERIDFIFTDFPPRQVQARLVGNRAADKTRRHRLWLSDHAGWSRSSWSTKHARVPSASLADRPE